MATYLWSRISTESLMGKYLGYSTVVRFALTDHIPVERYWLSTLIYSWGEAAFFFQAQARAGTRLNTYAWRHCRIGYCCMAYHWETPSVMHRMEVLERWRTFHRLQSVLSRRFNVLQYGLHVIVHLLVMDEAPQLCSYITRLSRSEITIYFVWLIPHGIVYRCRHHLIFFVACSGRYRATESRSFTIVIYSTPTFL